LQVDLVLAQTLVESLHFGELVAERRLFGFEFVQCQLDLCVVSLNLKDKTKEETFTKDV